MRHTSITRVEALDIRFPTSLALDGSDAMNPDPDYSVAYVLLHTSDPSLTGHGFTFTIGEGTEVCVAAIRALARHVEGLPVEEMVTDLGALSRRLIGISPLRWLGPEKGILHLATAAILNAAWDLAGKLAGAPVWRLVAGMTPEEQVALVDFRYLTDVLTPTRHCPGFGSRPRAGRSGSRPSSARAIPRTPRPRGGWAMTTTRSAGCATRPSPTALTTSSSRWAGASRTTSAARASRARSSAPTGT